MKTMMFSIDPFKVKESQEFLVRYEEYKKLFSFLSLYPRGPYFGVGAVEKGMRSGHALPPRQNQHLSSFRFFIL
jgi:hypothetical protein